MDNSGNFDEKTMLLEQDRLAREQKKKNNRKKKRIAGVLVLVLAAGGIGYGIWGRQLTAADSQTTVKITPKSGQEIIFAKLNSVKGNEITYTVAEEAGNTADTEERGGKQNDTPMGERPEGENAEMPQMGEALMGERGERPEGENAEEMGEALAGGRGQRPKGGNAEMPQMGEAPAGDTFTYENVTYRLTEETVTAQIPVGTEVTTKLGTVTTFSRLTAGDYVALVVETSGEEQIIVAVYIVG